MVKKKTRPVLLDGLIKKSEEAKYEKLLYIAVALLLILTVRLFYMQVVEGAYYKAQADGNRIRQVPVQAPRGGMYDRNGIVLAGSRPAYTVILSTENKKWKTDDEEIARLADVLKIKPEDIREKIKAHGKEFGPIRLLSDAGLDVVTQLEEHKEEFPGVEIQMQPLRVYPLQNAGAQVIGYVGEADPGEKDKNGKVYDPGTLVGKTGLELFYNDYLAGVNGARKVVVDASGQPVHSFTSDPIVPGHNVRMTIDANLQKATEDAVIDQLKILSKSHVNTTGVSAVAVDPNSGAILAMVSWPDYDPNNFSRGITEKEWNAIVQNPDHPMQNRVISSMYPPGSTFKVITGSAGLEDKVITPNERIFDSGRHWLIDKRNASGEAFGWVNFYDAVAKSDNVYFYEVGRRLGIDKIAAMARAFGLGKKTGIDLPNESDGNVASEEYKRKVFNQDWYLGETFDAAIGQSYTLTTPLQMAMVYSAVANGGVLYKPYLVNRIDELDGTPMKIFEPQKTGILPVSRANLDVIRNALRGVMQKGGTGEDTFENFPIPTAGKSGTAETNGLDNAWFVAYAPFDKPEIVVLVMFEHSGFGADSSAPVVKKMLECYFHLNGYANKQLPGQPAVGAKKEGHTP